MTLCVRVIDEVDADDTPGYAGQVHSGKAAAEHAMERGDHVQKKLRGRAR
jgi:hypothetical protein